MDKWDYIEEIRNRSKHGKDFLLELMEKYDKYSIAEITYEEAKEFYESMKRRRFYV